MIKLFLLIAITCFILVISKWNCLLFIKLLWLCRCRLYVIVIEIVKVKIIMQISVSILWLRVHWLIQCLIVNSIPLGTFDLMDVIFRCLIKCLYSLIICRLSNMSRFKWLTNNLLLIFFFNVVTSFIKSFHMVRFSFWGHHKWAHFHRRIPMRVKKNSSFKLFSLYYRMNIIRIKDLLLDCYLMILSIWMLMLMLLWP